MTGASRRARLRFTGPPSLLAVNTLFESVLDGRGAELAQELAEARRELEQWRREGDSAEVVIAGVVTIDPRVRWNLDFHRRRVRALERAHAEITKAEARA